jgi:hypothetical protein
MPDSVRTTRTEVVHEHAMSAHVYWKAYMSFTFRRRLLLDGLGFQSVMLEEERDGAGTRFLRLSMIPKLVLPHAVVKLVGSSFTLLEEGIFDAKESRYSFRTIPTVLGDRVRIEGCVTVEDVGNGRCVRKATMDYSLRTRHSGGLVDDLLERSSAKNMREGWARGVPFIEAYGPAWFARLPQEEKARLP